MVSLINFELQGCVFDASHRFQKIELCGGYALELILKLFPNSKLSDTFPSGNRSIFCHAIRDPRLMNLSDISSIEQLLKSRNPGKDATDPFFALESSPQCSLSNPF